MPMSNGLPDQRPVPEQSPGAIRELVMSLLAAPGLPAIVQAGHPALRQPSAIVDSQLSVGELEHLVDLMRDVMHDAPGVGLAAPQLGIPLQLAVLEDLYPVSAEISGTRNRHPLEFRTLINPSYVAVGSATASFFEGCLSLDGLQAVVQRAGKVELTSTDLTGAVTRETFEGWQARIVQHEVDHLAGILYVDRAELRSLCSNTEYGRWAEPGIEGARQELGFLPDPHWAPGRH